MRTKRCQLTHKHEVMKPLAQMATPLAIMPDHVHSQLCPSEPRHIQ